MKKINFTYGNTDYTLAFTLRTVKQSERLGLDISAMQSKPATMYPLLFRCSFLAYHSKVDQKTIDEIWNFITNKSGLINALADMYGEELEALMGVNESVDEEEDEKNANWTLT